ncbi:hypothetical protein [Fischerella thermalis]|uniref:Uncharacterized protein n=1 Tax=Fischerella thermalis CCMEE 5318 TaxID=2019666 RepID=A0A2N6LG55_9CYAN|nr:hypothetical protein [Fischerella thermalis]PMB22777.1 hypothetical protein CEN46_11630 [Fischerella thermalis CCMEE 5318]
MSQSAFINQIASELVIKLQGQADEQTIRELTLNSWKLLRNEITSEGSINRARTTLRKAVESAFPTSDNAKPGYYFTAAGKGKGERYEHLALWYLTTNEERWQVIGDKARQEYWSKLPELRGRILEKEEGLKPLDLSMGQSGYSNRTLPLFPKPNALPKSETSHQPQPQQKIRLEDMSIEQMELDEETKSIVENALAHSGISLADFVRQALKIHGKTIIGKAVQTSQDLASVETQKLLSDKAYRTHPKRVEELTRRAIQAIKRYNSEIATESSQRWAITQTLISAITGSRANAVKEVIENFASDLADYNTRLQQELGMNQRQFQYLNRKGKQPSEVIKLSELVPIGD